MGLFAEVYRRRGLKVNAGKSKVMVLNGKEGLKYEVHVDGIRLSMSWNLNIWGVFWINQVQMEQNVIERWRFAGAIRSLVNARDLQLEYARAFHETL